MQYDSHDSVAGNTPAIQSDLSASSPNTGKE
jgi:hypothetical protein